MATFPRLSTGAVSQYPTARRLSYSTCITRFVDGGEQRFRELSGPVRRWVIRLSQMSANEAGVIELFFLSMQGQFGSFSFVDPWDDTEYPNCSFDQETLSTEVSSESHIHNTLLIRNNAL